MATTSTWPIKDLSQRTWYAACDAARRAVRLIATDIPPKQRRIGLIASSHQRASLKAARDARSFLYRSHCFDDRSKGAIWPPLRRLVAEAALQRNYSRHINRLGIFVASSFLVFFIILAPLSLASWLYGIPVPVILDYAPYRLTRPTVSLLILSACASFVGIFVLDFPILFYLMRRRKHFNYLLRIGLLAFIGFFWLIASLLLKYLARLVTYCTDMQIPDGLTGLIGAILMGAGLYLTLPLIWLVIWSQIKYVIDMLWRNPSEEAKIVENLLNILHNTADFQTSWVHARFRARIIRDLENTARIIEVMMPKMLRAREAATQGWADRRFAEIASSIRDLEKWVMTPRDDTLRELQFQVAQRMSCIVCGDWDGLARLPIERVTRTVRIARLKSCLSALLLAISPLLALRVLQESKLALSGEVMNVAVIGAVLWAVITMLQVVDPLLRDRIAILKEIAGMLPGFGKEGTK